MKIQFISILIACLLTGCSIVNSYQEPSSSKVNIATISGSGPKSGIFDREATENNITSIDNKEIAIIWSHDSKINITTGKHSITGIVNYSPGTLACCRKLTIQCYASAEVPMTINAKEGENYRFISQPLDKSCEQVKVSIVNKNDKVISEKVVDFNITLVSYY